VRHLVADGERVNAGEPFAEIEVMKMLMPLSSPAAGKVNFKVQEGSAMAAGDLIAQLDLDDPTAVERATPYAGGFPELGPPLVHSQGVDHRFTQAETAAKMIMAGYDHPVDAVVADLLACLDDPALALLQWTNVFSVVQTRLPVELANELERLAAAHEQDLMCAVGSGSDDGGVDVSAAMNAAIAANAAGNNGNLARAASSSGGGFSLEFPARALLAAIKAAIEGADTPADGSAIAAQAEPLVKVARAHQNGKEAYARAVATELFEDFLAVEEKFSPSAAAAAAAKAATAGGVDVAASSAGGDAAPAPAPAAAAAAAAAPAGAAADASASAGSAGDGAAAGGDKSGVPLTEQEVIDSLRRVHAKNLGAVVDIVVSHMGLPLKIRLASQLMAALVLPAPERYRPILRRFAALGSAGAGGAPTSSGGGEASALAAQLLEHSLLAELQHVVARALSGLEMFAGTQLSEADLLTPRASTANASSSGSIFGAADAASSDAAAADSLAAAVSAAPGAAALPSALSSELQRRPTIVEGLYSGLSGGASLAATQLDAKVRLLVEAPAAVDDALASLLDSADATLQSRALSTYIQRVYYPFITKAPELTGGAASAASANPTPLAAAWAHEHPGLDGTPSARVATSAALVLPALDALAAGLRSVEDAVAAAGLAGAAGTPRGTLHIVLTRGGDAALSIAPDAVVGLPAAREAAAVFGSSSSSASSSSSSSDPLAVDPRPAVAAITAAVRALNATISAAGYEAVSVLVKPRGGSEFGGGMMMGGGGSAATKGRSAAVAVAPLRVGLVRPRGDPSEPLTPDPLLSAVEPPTAALLELARLAPFGAGRISYAASRNRQAHAYAVTERRDARSLPLKRVFIRGALRQLSSPAVSKRIFFFVFFSLQVFFLTHSLFLFFFLLLLQLPHTTTAPCRHLQGRRSRRRRRGDGRGRRRPRGRPPRAPARRRGRQRHGRWRWLLGRGLLLRRGRQRRLGPRLPHGPASSSSAHRRGLLVGRGRLVARRRSAARRRRDRHGPPRPGPPPRGPRPVGGPPPRGRRRRRLARRRRQPHGARDGRGLCVCLPRGRRRRRRLRRGALARRRRRRAGLPARSGDQAPRFSCWPPSADPLPSLGGLTAEEAGSSQAPDHLLLRLPLGL
jgi:pyruvate/2-oxoglutarate dehydrogenase complex dihydrolipoamide acyltransferase (E2) component